MMSEPGHADITSEFREFVGAEDYPCLAGRGVVNAGHDVVHVYGTLGSRQSARALAADLAAFVDLARQPDGPLRALVAVFPDHAPPDELEFERRLWLQLQKLHECDHTDRGWAPGASDDPGDERFSYSFAGQALFVIGMHPASSRLARRFRYPALVFNSHAQFDHLREAGKFDRLRGAVREREIALQGSINPNLADFGDRSEAAQYSGRETEAQWHCPFHRKDR